MNPYQNNYRQGRNREESYDECTEDYADLVSIALNLTESNVKDFVKNSEKLAKDFKEIKPSKFREFYDYIKKAELDLANKKDNWGKVYKDLYLLIPKLAYQIGRAKEQSRSEVYPLSCFKKLYEQFIDKLTFENFHNFVKFFEAIVAYHKVHAKRE